jgi:spore maturation protein CgeB
MKYDYGKPEQGHSFEHNNFFDCLLHMGHDILYFDTGTLTKSLGREGFNRRLREIVSVERPDLMFTVLYRNELDRSIVREISEGGQTPTFNWFCDDHWRFESFSSVWAPCFNWVATTAQSAVSKYALLGYERAIKTQWASNPFMYRPLELPLAYDVTFVGQPHGDRRYVLERVRSAGIDLSAWGDGWPAGRLSQVQMIDVFNQSRVNLNLANATRPRSPWDRAAGFIVRNSMRIPLDGWRRKLLFRVLARLQPRQSGSQTSHYLEQIKGRNFEVPGCAGFLLTGQAENLSDYYEPGREVTTFASLDSLVEQIRYYLANDDERAAVAAAGYSRTMREHTYVHRFTNIFARIGLPTKPVDDILSGHVSPG